jgi:RNA polymerase sigma-70 factor (ECF subfamily)
MTTELWVEELKRGSEEAFVSLYQLYAPSLMRHLVNMLGNQQEAEEMLHEVMMLMLQKISYYSPRADLKNSFKAWLWRLATHRAIDEIRRRKGRMEEWSETSVASEENIEEQYEKREEEGLIGELLQQLPLMQRMVLGLRVNDDLSYLEISAVLGRDVNTVKQGLFHARKRMKELLIQKGAWA